MTIGRLILALLLACLALPAIGAMPCHDGEAMPAAMTHDAPAPGGHHRDAVAAAHICIGCVPPSSWRRAPLVAPLLWRPMVPVAAQPTLPLRDWRQPATPPPRRLA